MVGHIHKVGERISIGNLTTSNDTRASIEWTTFFPTYPSKSNSFQSFPWRLIYRVWIPGAISIYFYDFISPFTTKARGSVSSDFQTPRNFDSPLGVWKSDETLSLVFDTDITSIWYDSLSCCDFGGKNIGSCDARVTLWRENTPSDWLQFPRHVVVVHSNRKRTIPHKDQII